MEWNTENLKILGTVATASATVVGALIGAAIKGRAAKRDLIATQIAYEAQLQEKYFESARQYVNSVYVPLAISMSKLNSSHKAFRSRSSCAEHRECFQVSINEFHGEVDALAREGATAFYTTDLDEKLQSFNDFILSSLDATKPVIRSTLEVDTSILAPIVRIPNFKREFTLNRNIFRNSVSFYIGGLTAHADVTLAAPIESDEFEDRFVKDMYDLNRLIKEVTLGSGTAATVVS